MLTEICADLRNWFSRPADRHPGAYEISGGAIAPLDFLQNGQYFRIVGSVFNDGVHQYPAADLTDETFTGSIWAMQIPPAFLDLVKEIQEYNASEAAKPSAFTSESFGNYSYSRATGKNGETISWAAQFASRLRPWRKM